MRTRHRHRSQEIAFNAKVSESIQKNYGGTGTPAVLLGRSITAAFTCLGSQAPLHARFLDKIATGGGGG
jgi:hypothetical protein